MNQAAKLDALALEIILTRIISATDEASETLKRTSFSTLVTESNDLAVVVTDTAGNLIGQNTDSIPAFIGTLPVTIKHLLSVFGNDLQEGDILATNDPWVGSGHLNDISLVRPIFHNRRLACFAGSCAHAPDIGGRGRSLESREVYEEGFMIPPLKIVRAGSVDETFFALYRASSRMPAEAEGDIWAGINALAAVEQRVGSILRGYELPNLDGVAREINGRSEAAMRKAIRALPMGVYRHTFETDGLDVPLRFSVCITVEDGDIQVDFAGTSPSVPKAINCPMTYTAAMAAYALKCLLLPELPNCEGPLQCFTVTAPEGCIVNPARPASVAGRAAVGQYVPPLIFAALAVILPGRVMATPGSPLWSCVLTSAGRNGRGSNSQTLFFNGGMGATAEFDGEPCYSWPSNVSSVPVEVVEARSPVLLTYKRLAADSGGVGRRRGGLGLETAFTVEADVLMAKFIAERCRFAAEGLLGGGNGMAGAVCINGEPVDARRDHLLRAGDEVYLRTPGGAGLGPPEEREAAHVRLDVTLGYASEGAAAAKEAAA